MKFFLIITLTLSLLLVGCSNDNKSQSEQAENTNYDISRTKTTNEQNVPPPETDIASFSTKIYIKESGRQHNIGLTCSKLNGTIVKSRRNFFFLQYSWKSNSR